MFHFNSTSRVTLNLTRSQLWESREKWAEARWPFAGRVRSRVGGYIVELECEHRGENRGLYQSDNAELQMFKHPRRAAPRALHDYVEAGHKKVKAVGPWALPAVQNRQLSTRVRPFNAPSKLSEMISSLCLAFRLAYTCRRYNEQPLTR